jgi:hypothetical protein
MRRTSILRTLFVFSAFLLLSSCEYDTIEPDIIPIPPDQTISFIQDILPVFSAKCVECHDGNRKPDLRNDKAYGALINEYINTNEPESSKLYEVLTGFHSDKASAQEKQLILRWIEQGAKDN